jgi:hypothetical protein
MEATESPDVVLQYYAQLLDADSANAVGDIYLSPAYATHQIPRRLYGSVKFPFFAAPGR